MHLRAGGANKEERAPTSPGKRLGASKDNARHCITKISRVHVQIRDNNTARGIFKHRGYGA